MKRKLLMTGAAIALLAGVNAASAQMGGQQQQGGQQPSMQNAPSGGGTSRGEEKIKPGVHEKEPGAAVKNEQKEKTKVGQGETGNQPGMSKEKLGQSESKEKMGQSKEQTQTKEKMGRDEKSGQGQIQGQGQMEQKVRSTQQGTQKNQVQSQDQKQGTQQGTQGSAKSVQLSSEQRTKIRTTLINTKVERVTNVNFSIRVGTHVPRTVRFYPLPVEIVEIVPEYRGYDYVLVGDEILIIDPETLEIVAILPA